MRAAAGLLLLLIGLPGSQAQDGGCAGHSDVWTEVRALRAMLMEAMVKLTVLQTQLDGLKAQQAPGKQPQNAKLFYLWWFCHFLCSQFKA